MSTYCSYQMGLMSSCTGTTSGIDDNEKTAPDQQIQNGPMNRGDDPTLGEQPLSQTIAILHFNDVYNIEAREEEPVGGAARFATAMRQRKHLDPLVLFSGDIFNPSVMSAVTKGEQMVPILQALGVHCAVFGNHDFDFGMDHAADLVKRTHFPWLMSNVYDSVTENTLADGCVTHMISRNGRKIGLVGLVEEAWIETLATVDPEEIMFVDFISEGRLLARQLRQEGADIVIALTHMRWPNDIRLAECAPEIDLILGGHDHDYLIKQINGKYVIKSGTDFRNFSEVTLTFLDDGRIDVNVKEIVVDSSFQEDPEVKSIVNRYTEVMDEKMETVLGNIDVDLDGRFSKVRTQETNLGNFVTDIMLKSVDADLALLNAGTLRSDVVHKTGPFKMKDLLAILPMVDPMVVIQVTGQQIVSALENSVSQYPTLEGRFAQLAGVRFSFDAGESPWQRINPDDVEVQGIRLDLEQNYRLCTKQYMAEGKDGYTALKGCTVLLGEEELPRLSTCVINYFKSVQMLRGQEKSMHCHRHSILPVTRWKTLTRQMSVDFSMGTETQVEHSPSSSWYHLNVNMLRKKSLVRQMSVDLTDDHAAPNTDDSSSFSRTMALLQRRNSIEVCEKESVATALAPAIDGRIRVINDLV